VSVLTLFVWHHVVSQTLKNAYACPWTVLCKDWVIDMGWKTCPHRFLWKSEKSSGFWYKIQILKFEGENQKPLYFLKKPLGLFGLTICFQLLFHSKFIFWMKTINRSRPVHFFRFTARLFLVYRPVFSGFQIKKNSNETIRFLANRQNRSRPVLLVFAKTSRFS
jgi:hypothetical protein